MPHTNVTMIQSQRVEKDGQEDLDDELDHVLILSLSVVTLGKAAYVVLLTRYADREARF